MIYFIIINIIIIIINLFITAIIQDLFFTFCLTRTWEWHRSRP